MSFQAGMRSGIFIFFSPITLSNQTTLHYYYFDMYHNFSSFQLFALDFIIVYNSYGVQLFALDFYDYNNSSGLFNVTILNETVSHLLQRRKRRLNHNHNRYGISLALSLLNHYHCLMCQCTKLHR